MGVDGHISVYYSQFQLLFESCSKQPMLRGWFSSTAIDRLGLSMRGEHAMRSSMARGYLVGVCLAVE